MYNFASEECEEDIETLLEEDNRIDMFRLILTDVPYYINLIMHNEYLKDLLQILPGRIKGRLFIKFRFTNDNSPWHEVGVMGDTYQDDHVYDQFAFIVDGFIKEPHADVRNPIKVCNAPIKHKLNCTSKPSIIASKAIKPSIDAPQVLKPQYLGVSKREKYLREKQGLPPKKVDFDEILFNNSDKTDVDIDAVVDVESDCDNDTCVCESDIGEDEETYNAPEDDQIDLSKIVSSIIPSHSGGTVSIKNIIITNLIININK